MILFYDTETTGLPKKLPLEHIEQPRIVQLGAILDFEDGREAMRLDFTLRHENLPASVIESWDEAAKIHGVTREIADKIGVTADIAIELFLDLVAVADTVVGQNHVRFDNPIVTGSVRRQFGDASLDPFAGKAQFDTMKAGAAIMNHRGQFGPNLTKLHTHLFGEGFEGAHTAISDVLATRRCFYEMQRRAAEARAAREQKVSG